MVPFKPYFIGDEPPPYRRADVGAEVRPRRRQAQRPRRHRPHEPALQLLRDARQLQLRRLLQGRGDPVRVGALHRRARARPDAALGDRPRDRRRGRGDLARRRRRPARAHPAPGRGQLLDAWATPGRAGRRRRSSGISARSSGPRADPKHGAEDRYVEIWNLVFMQFDQRSRRDAVPLPAPERRHRCRPRAQPGRPAGRGVHLGHRRLPAR